MKKAFILIYLLAFCLSIQAQDHLKFNGIPIDGTMSEFVQKMEQDGFVCERIKEGSATLKGDFAGYKNCAVSVCVLRSCDLVNLVYVKFPERKCWKKLLRDYRTLKSMLKEMYGSPTDEVEDCLGNMPSVKHKMKALYSRDCECYAIFRTDLGLIRLSLSGSSSNTARVSIAYEDENNSEFVHDAAMDNVFVVTDIRKDTLYVERKDGKENFYYILKASVLNNSDSIWSSATLSGHLIIYYKNGMDVEATSLCVLVSPANPWEPDTKREFSVKVPGLGREYMEKAADQVYFGLKIGAWVSRDSGYAKYILVHKILDQWNRLKEIGH